MATRPLLHPGTDRITTPGPLKVGEDGKIGVAGVEAVNLFLSSVVSKMNGNLTLGNGAHGTWAGNFYWQWIEFTSPSVADTEFTVPHGLDKVPQGFISVFQDKAGSLYVSSYGSWGKDLAYMKDSGASVLRKILIV